MAIKTCLPHFSYKLLYFAEVIIFAKWNRFIIYALLYLCLYQTYAKRTLPGDYVHTGIFHLESQRDWGRLCEMAPVRIIGLHTLKFIVSVDSNVYRA